MLVPPSVIVVEDDDDFRASVVGYLDESQVDVRGVCDGSAMMVAWEERPADILILDINLPGENGISIASWMREKSTVGIIMLTALSHEATRIAGIEGGADYYLVKPVVLRELLATIRRLYQRMTASTPESGPIATWELDSLNWTLVTPEGKVIRLTGSEHRFLSLFHGTPGNVIARDQILQVMGKGGGSASVHGLESVIARLRRKVLTEGGVQLPLRASSSLGYSLQCWLNKR